MTPAAPGPSAHADLEADLKAAVGARRELGPDLEDQVLQSFLTRLEQHIDERVAQQMARRGSRNPEVSAERHLWPFEAAVVVVGSLGLAIPLIAIAGRSGQSVVMGVIFLINLMYFKWGRH